MHYMHGSIISLNRIFKYMNYKNYEIKTINELLKNHE